MDKMVLNQYFKTPLKVAYHKWIDNDYIQSPNGKNILTGCDFKSFTDYCKTVFEEGMDEFFEEISHEYNANLDIEGLKFNDTKIGEIGGKVDGDPIIEKEAKFPPLSEFPMIYDKDYSQYVPPTGFIEKEVTIDFISKIKIKDIDAFYNKFLPEAKGVEDDILILLGIIPDPNPAPPPDPSLPPLPPPPPVEEVLPTLPDYPFYKVFVDKYNEDFEFTIKSSKKFIAKIIIHNDSLGLFTEKRYNQKYANLDPETGIVTCYYDDDGNAIDPQVKWKEMFKFQCPE